MAFQDNFIKAHTYLCERQKTVQQDGYRSNNLVGIEEAFSKLAQFMEDYRAVVNNFTGARLENASSIPTRLLDL